MDRDTDRIHVGLACLMSAAQATNVGKANIYAGRLLATFPAMVVSVAVDDKPLPYKLHSGKPYSTSLRANTLRSVTISVHDGEDQWMIENSVIYWTTSGRNLEAYKCMEIVPWPK